MNRFFLLSLVALALPLTAGAADAPSGQLHLDAHTVLRGHFVQEHQMVGVNSPVISSGHFVVAPASGLLWNIEQPFPTSIIITPNGATQNIAGIVMKLPAKNLRHIYDMVRGALAGDWTGLEKDFTITRQGNAHNWQMLLTPITPNGTDKPKVSYATITVSGSHFVETILMTKKDGTSDSFQFTDEVASSDPMSAKETAAFGQAVP